MRNSLMRICKQHTSFGVFRKGDNTRFPDAEFLTEVSYDLADALGITNDVMLECLLAIYSLSEDTYCDKVTPSEFRVIRNLVTFVKLVLLGNGESDRVGDTISFVYHNMNTGKIVLWSHCWGIGRGLISKEQPQ